MQITVIRTNLSSYLDNDFVQKEREIIESLGLNYSYGEIPEAGPWILITNTQSQLDHLSVSQIDRLQLIIHPNSGYDNFPVELVKESSFPIITGNPIRAHAVANYIVSSVWQHFSPIPHQENWHKARYWERSLLNQKNILVMGNGQIGKLVSNSLKPVCKSLSIYDPFLGYHDCDVAQADIVLLCASLNPSSQKLINKGFLKKLPKDFLLVNAARGGLVDQQALLEVLSESPKAQAILDVFESEPYFPEEFKGLENLITTSHIAGVSDSLNDEMLNFEKMVLSDFNSIEANNDFFNNKYKDLLLENRLQDGFLI
jgi:D-3-phosphoglycerate dehydrogenase